MTDDEFLAFLQLPKPALLEYIHAQLARIPGTAAGASDGDPASPDPMAILREPIELLRRRIAEELGDGIVSRTPAGQFEWRVADDELTQIVVTRRERLEQAISSADSPARARLERQRAVAVRLLDLLSRRHSILHKLGTAILQHHQRFLETGCGDIVPVGMEQVVAETGLPMRMIEHALQNKWANTQQGMIPLADFVSRAATETDGQ